MSASLLLRAMTRRSVSAVRAAAAAPAAQPRQTTRPARPFHSDAPLAFRAALPRLGGGGHDGAHHVGTDFLSVANVERRVRMVLSEIDKVDQAKLKDLNT